MKNNIENFQNNVAINKMLTWNLQDILILAAGQLYFYGLILRIKGKMGDDYINPI